MIKLNNNKQSQKGSIIIEVIAVIALLAVLGPLLFRQITQRNEEVNNVNAASEIRLVKEAFTSYIQANISDLNSEIINASHTFSGGEPFTDFANLAEGICDFIPDTHLDLLGCADSADSAYRLHLFAYATDETGTSNSINYVGLIVPLADAIPENLGLKRAARIANLIGADGGVYVDGEVYGVAGAWTDVGGDFATAIGEDYGPEQELYLAITAVNSYESNVAVEDFDKDRINLPETLAEAKLHVYDYFAVGNDLGCYKNKADVDDNISDEVYPYNGTSCKPDFWVAASPAEDPNGDFQIGHVYAKNGLHIGEPIISTADSNKKSAFNFDVSDSSDAETKFTVYNTKGNEVVSIDATGKIVSFNKGDDSRPKVKFNEETKKYELTSEPIDEQLIIHSARIDTNIKAEKTSEKTGEIANYRLDPANMSVMNDIRLESKGGLKLSELLPDYILKTTEKQQISNNESIEKPKCPNGMTSALVIVPLESKIKVADIVKNLNASLNKTTVTIEPKDTDALVGTNTIEFNIEDSGETWTVKTNSTEPVNVIIQKYCVFDKSTAPAEATLR